MVSLSTFSYINEWLPFSPLCKVKASLVYFTDKGVKMLSALNLRGLEPHPLEVMCSDTLHCPSWSFQHTQVASPDFLVYSECSVGRVVAECCFLQKRLEEHAIKAAPWLEGGWWKQELVYGCIVRLKKGKSRTKQKIKEKRKGMESYKRIKTKMLTAHYVP